MKTAISIPDAIFSAADSLAKRLGMSRSELYSRAVALFVENHNAASVTESLNRVYSHEDSRLDDALAEIQTRSISGEG